MLKLFVAGQARLADLKTRINTLKEDESGAALVEYALLVGLMATIVIAVVPLLKTSLTTAINNIGTHLTTLQ